LISEITKKYTQISPVCTNSNIVKYPVNDNNLKKPTQSTLYDNIVFDAKIVNDNNGGYIIIVTINQPVEVNTKYGVVKFAMEQNVDITIAGHNFYVTTTNDNNRYILGNTINDTVNTYYYLPSGIIPLGTNIDINGLSVSLEENVSFEFPNRLKLLFEKGTIIQGTNNDMVAQLLTKTSFFVKMVSHTQNNSVNKENTISNTDNHDNDTNYEGQDIYDDMPELEDDNQNNNLYDQIFDGSDDISDANLE
jgi:hypothetical protein